LCTLVASHERRLRQFDNRHLLVSGHVVDESLDLGTRNRQPSPSGCWSGAHDLSAG
jgi:hypothetical protein